MAGKDPKDLVVSWLNDAYGMENSLIQVLEHRVKDAQDFPQMQGRIQQHLEETRRHAEMVKSCIERLGGSTSTIKTGLASLFGQLQAPMTGAASDELIKNALTDYGAESFEVASYTSLVAGATALGDQETASVCQQILREDQDMANWIESNIPTLTTEVMNRTAAPTS